jgi:Flp pilus assembly pilin Flp
VTERRRENTGLAMRLMLRFWRNESGSTITEYALIGGFISVALLATFVSIGNKVNHMFVPIDNALN